MDSIVLAGGRFAPTDALHAQAPNGYKCLLELGGKPMVQWSLDALSDTRDIDRVIVVGLPVSTELRCRHQLTLIEGGSDMIGSIQAAGQYLLREGADAAGHALIVSADAPLISGAMVQWLLERVAENDDDLSICVVERAVMEARFPESKRTYVRLRDTDVCGGDVNACRLSVTRRGVAIAERLARARKSPLRLALIIGLDTLVQLVLRRLTLAQAMRTISARLGVSAGAIVCPYAEVGMDVDKPSQLAIARAILKARGDAEPGRDANPGRDADPG